MERLQFYATITENLALTVANLRLRETLRRQALRDPLTGLFNRRYLVDSLERELERAEGLDQFVSVTMFDIDHFKRFNDEFGHAAGDAVLSTLGELLQKRIRAADMVARYGGEEFGIVMSDTDGQVAHSRVEALREEIAALNVQQNGRALGRVSISAGIAVFPTEGNSPSALLQAADIAMYGAKKSGRNRVVLTKNTPAIRKEDRTELEIDSAA